MLLFPCFFVSQQQLSSPNYSTSLTCSDQEARGAPQKPYSLWQNGLPFPPTFSHQIIILRFLFLKIIKLEEIIEQDFNTTEENLTSLKKIFVNRLQQIIGNTHKYPMLGFSFQTGLPIIEKEFEQPNPSLKKPSSHDVKPWCFSVQESKPKIFCEGVGLYLTSLIRTVIICQILLT